MGTDLTALWPMGWAMSEDHTTAVVRRYLDEPAGDSPAEPIVRALLDRAVGRLQESGDGCRIVGNQAPHRPFAG
jgi:hypothetical protein